MTHSEQNNFFNEPTQKFEIYGIFIFYIIGLLYSGYAFYIIVDFFLIPACNNISKFITRLIKNTFIANLVMISASCMPELFIGIIGFITLKEMLFPSAIIFGCTLVNSLLQAGLSSFISLDNVVVTKSVFVRDATFFIVSVIIIYFFSSNFTLDNLEQKSESPETTYLIILLWICLFIYIMYIIALTLMSFLTKKRIYDHHFGFFGKLLNRKHKENENLLPNENENQVEIPIELNDNNVVQLHSGLLFVKSQFYTNVTFSSCQWSQHWCELFRDELVIHKDVNPMSPISQTIPITSISKVTCDTTDPNFFILSVWNGQHTVKYTMRSNQRNSWISYFEVLLQDNNTLVKENKTQSFFQTMQRKFSCRQFIPESHVLLQMPRKKMKQIVYIFFYPLLVLLTYTIPDVKQKNCNRMSFISIVICLLYLALFALLALFCGYRLSIITTCPSDIFGFTVVALILSVRHIISGWVSGRMMCGNLAILNSYSMSLFFINVAVVIPWMLFYYTKGTNYEIEDINVYLRYTPWALEFVVAGMIFVSICHLFSTIGFKNLIINHKFGLLLVVLYMIIFVSILMTWIGVSDNDSSQ